MEKNGRMIGGRRWLLVAAIFLCSTIGCGGSNAIVGRWNVDRAATAKHFPHSQILRGLFATASVSCEFNANGEAFFIGNGRRAKGTWKKSMGNYLVTVNGRTMSLRLKGDLLIDNVKNSPDGVVFRRSTNSDTAPSGAPAPQQASPDTVAQNPLFNNTPSSSSPGEPRAPSMTPSIRPNSPRAPSTTPSTRGSFPSRTRSRPPTRSRTKPKTPVVVEGEKHRLDVASTTAVAFSPDAKKLLVVAGQSCQIFAVTNPSTELSSFELPAACTHVVYATDGQHALAWGKQSKAFHVDTTAGKVLLEVDHGGTITAAAISPDGTTIATGGERVDNVKIWDAKSGAEKGRYTKKSGTALCLVFTEDSKQIYVGEEQAYSMIDMTGRQTSPRVTFIGGKRVNAMAFGPQQRRALIGTELWDLVDGAEIATVHEGSTSYLKLAISNSPWAVVGDTWNRQAQLIDQRNGTKAKKLGPLPNRISTLAISPDGKWVAIASSYHVRLFDTPTPSAAPVASKTDNTPKVIDNGRVQELRRLKAPSSFFHPSIASISPDGAFALIGSSQPIFYFDLATGRRLGSRAFEGQKNVVSVDFSADGEIAITGDSEGGVYLWNTTSGQMIKKLTGHSRGTVYVSISPDGTKAITGSQRNEKELVAWDLQPETPKVVATLKGHVKDLLGVQAMGNGYAASASTHAIAIWNLTTGKNFSVMPIAKPTGIQYATHAAFSNNGRLAFVSMRQGFQVWDVQNKKALFGNQDRSFTIDALDLSADGRIGVFSNSSDGTISVWDFEGKKEIDNFKPEKRINAVNLSLDGRQFLTSSWYGPLVLYQLPKRAKTKKP